MKVDLIELKKLEKFYTVSSAPGCANLFYFSWRYTFDCGIKSSEIFILEINIKLKVPIIHKLCFCKMFQGGYFVNFLYCKFDVKILIWQFCIFAREIIKFFCILCFMLNYIKIVKCIVCQMVKLNLFKYTVQRQSGLTMGKPKLSIVSRA